jgi:hypothetical protein
MDDKILIVKIDNGEQVVKCQFCGDSCGESICYNCQDTADDFGIDFEEG